MIFNVSMARDFENSGPDGDFRVGPIDFPYLEIELRCPMNVRRNFWVFESRVCPIVRDFEVMTSKRVSFHLKSTDSSHTFRRVAGPGEKPA